MIMKLNRIGWLLTIILVSYVHMPNNACAQEEEQFLEWSIGTSKKAFYPGEPVLLTLNIKNTETWEEEVFFGADGIGAFSMEIRDSNNIIITKGNKIERGGITTVSPFLKVIPGGAGQKSIVLNRWCSTLLPTGKYKVICNVEYLLRTEFIKMEDSDGFKAGPIHKIQLDLEIQIIEMDKDKFKKIIETLLGSEIKPEAQSKREWMDKREVAREMLAFTESELAVPYQLKLLKNDPRNRFGPDMINTLAKSKTQEAAKGLMEIAEDPNSERMGTKKYMIDAVYRLRETGKAEIINATEGFVAKYKRPVLGEVAD